MADENQPTIIEQDLDRLAELLTGVGREPFLRGAIVLPTTTWFPERWTPDLETVRRLSLRLLAYAGLEALEVECGVFDEFRHQWLPAVLGTGESTFHGGAAAMFLGLEDGCAYFAVDAQQLNIPETLVGVMAHEVAHVWRRVHGLEVPDRAEEEERTDLTTVVLGFGILSANAAYRYESSGEQVGAYATTRYSHRNTGYLGPDRLAWLLAVQCLVRRVDARVVRGHLDVTQKAAFDTAMRSLDSEAVVERLGLEQSFWTAYTDLGAPRPVEAKPGRAGRKLAALAESALAGTRGANGLLDEPLPFDLDLLETRNDTLATIGRPHRDGGWLIELSLVHEPEHRRALLVGSMHARGVAIAQILGSFEDQFVRRRREFRAALEGLFDPVGQRDLSLVEAPSFVQAHCPNVFGSDDLRAILNKALLRVGRDVLHADLCNFEGGLRSYSRVSSEGGGCEVAAAPSGFDFTKGLKQWWDWASNPGVVNDEYSTWLAFNGREVEEE